MKILSICRQDKGLISTHPVDKKNLIFFGRIFYRNQFTYPDKFVCGHEDFPVIEDIEKEDFSAYQEHWPKKRAIR